MRLNYAGVDCVALENVAIADRDGSLRLHYFAEDPGHKRAGDTFFALGSFSREIVRGHSHLPGYDEQRIVSAELPCISFESLLRRHGVERLELLVVDTEGYDYEILRRLDFATHRPRVLVYEDVHLSPRDHAQCKQLVEGLGYETLEEEFDTWCVDTRPDDRLTRSWRRIRAAGPAVPRHELDAWLQEMSQRR